MTGIAIVGGFLALVFMAAVFIYNNLVSCRNRFNNAFSQIDVQLKRRYDLIPNLVETVKGYLKHERETLEAVIEARNVATAARQQAKQTPGESAGIQALSSADAALTGMLGRLFALSESYPDLKADQNMARLQEELASTENRVSYARQAYNDAVTAYNILREKFPNNLIAGTFGFFEAELLTSTESDEQRAAPSVSF